MVQGRLTPKTFYDRRASIQALSSRRIVAGNHHRSYL
jgi:hypothetical protein